MRYIESSKQKKRKKMLLFPLFLTKGIELVNQTSLKKYRVMGYFENKLCFYASYRNTFCYNFKSHEKNLFD